MTVSQKIKTLDNKIEQNRAQYDLVRQTANICPCHQEMLVNINFYQVKMFYQKKRLVEKAAIIRRFKY